MRRPTRSMKVERINGFLYASSSLSGELREYENTAYCLDASDASRAAGELINDYFRGQHEFSFDDADEIDLRKLENGVRQYLVGDQTCVVEDRISNLRDYLSFRLMDMIEEVFGKAYSSLNVSEMHERSASVDCIFFCLRSRRLLLVLQFNHYTRPGEFDEPQT
jgi:hypothetical protein